MILLKQSLDVFLREHDLPNMYVERIPLSGGQLNLCGPCGKPIMSVPDVRIPHAKLSKNEREFVLQELTLFMLERMSDIKEVIKIKSNPISQPEHPDYKIRFEQSYSDDNDVSEVSVTKELERAKYDSGSTCVTLLKDGTFQYNFHKVTGKEFDKVLDEIDEMKKIAKDSWKVAVAKVKQEKRLDELKSCRY